ncbi:type II toxin-antitoxin system VapC family toxin [uncultured Methylobacterium sp.]|uniref:type II toxin-antitoxin system VapC family toxin n=1 Tax=uncultured Methylobacterium sp. TaxID=157278 RepID=UPI0035C98FDB
MKFVIDTSVAVKWFLPEADHDAAVALLETKAMFLAPDLIFTEFATAMQKKIKLGESRHDQARESCTSLPGLFASITPTLLLFQRALDIGVAMAHPVQDCIFLACAEQEGVPVVSADRKLTARASERGFGHLVFEMGVAIEAANAVSHAVAIPDTQLQNILRLNARVDTTFDDLRNRHVGPTKGFYFVPSEVLSPAFHSPAYLRLRDLVTALPRDQVRDLTALCWLGRGYDGSDWPNLQAKAEAAFGDTPSEINYVLSLLSYLQAGIDRVRVIPSPSDKPHRTS